MITLHGFDKSSCTVRVKLALALKGIDYAYKVVDVLSGAHRKPAYLEINPLGQVPAIEIDGVCLAQSVAICEYLEQTRPDPPLLPADASERARCRWLVEIVNAGIQPLQNRGLLLHLIDRYDDQELAAVLPGGPNKPKPPPEGAEPWPHFWIRKGFTALETLLPETARSHCIGDSVTLADVALFPQVTLARAFGIDLAPFPTIARIDDTLGRHPAFAELR